MSRVQPLDKRVSPRLLHADNCVWSRLQTRKFPISVDIYFTLPEVESYHLQFL